MCVCTDPQNYLTALQLVIDVLTSPKPGLIEYEEAHLIPIYFSNPDLLWKAQYPFSRFGQGAYRIALQKLYEARLQSLGASEVDVEKRISHFVQYGKHAVVQYRFAFRQLQRISGDAYIKHCYMVGDNPHSDMQGCVNMNNFAKEVCSWSSLVDGNVHLPRWSGVLVKTGVFTDGKDDTNQAAMVVEDVEEAVDWIIKQVER